MPARARDAALVMAAVVAAYANSLANRFAYDDVGIIARNPVVTGPGSAAEIWLGPYWPAFGEYLGLYRPLTIASYVAQWAVSGGAPWVFHAVSIALHAAVCLVLLALLRRLVSPAGALAGALLFALHPVHTEAVANLVGQAELMSALAVLAAATVWISLPHTNRWRLPAVALLYALGVLAKEHAIVLPGLLVALDFARGGTATRPWTWVRSTAPALLVLGLVAGGLLALRVAAIDSILGGNAGPALPFLRGADRIWAALRVWPEYARLLFFPLDLSSDYSPAVILPPEGPEPMVLFGGLLLLATVALALATPARRGAGLAAAWFLVAILPVSNLLFPIGVLLAERTLYLPSVAVAFAAGYAWDALSVRVPGRRVLLAASGMLLLGALGVRTALRNPAWQDSASLARTLYAEHPESYRAQWETARLSMEQGDTAAALDHYRLAFRLWPHDPGLLAAYGSFLVSIGAASEALPLLERAREALPFIPRVEGYVAEAHLSLGDRDGALASAERLERLGAAHEAAAVRARANALTPTPTTP